MTARIAERLALEDELRSAVERQQLVLHYQPKVDLSSGRITGAEALVRWQHPEMGIRAPAQFIPVAEESGLIIAIGEWVLRAACAQNKAWQDAYLPPIRSFVRDVASNPNDAAIVRAVISLGHSLQLDVTAEGVETEAQVAWLRRHRCEQVQGYYFSRAVPAEEFEQMLQDRKSLPAAASGKAESSTLLILDDEADVITSLARLLRRDDYRILTAQTAAEAFELLALNDVQVIISDTFFQGDLCPKGISR